MKKLFLSSFVLMGLLSAGCKKSNEGQCSVKGDFAGTVQIIKNCTGTYIRYQKKDYFVCNREQLKNKVDREWIYTSFHKVSVCKDMSGSICNMIYANEGQVEITCIR